MPASIGHSHGLYTVGSMRLQSCRRAPALRPPSAAWSRHRCPSRPRSGAFNAAQAAGRSLSSQATVTWGLHAIHVSEQLAVASRADRDRLSIVGQQRFDHVSRRAVQSEEVLHRFVQEGHDPVGRPEGLETEREPSCDVPINGEHRQFDVAPGIRTLIR